MEYVRWTGHLFVTGFLANAGAVQCGSWKMEYSPKSTGCSLRFEKQPRLLVCSTPMHKGRLYMEDYDQAWATILQRHSITNETIENGKKKRIELLKQQSEEKLVVKEQMQDNNIKQEAIIISLDQREEKYN
jgi:hypothetical protein